MMCKYTKERVTKRLHMWTRNDTGACIPIPKLTHFAGEKSEAVFLRHWLEIERGILSSGNIRWSNAQQPAPKYIQIKPRSHAMHANQ